MLQLSCLDFSFLLRNEEDTCHLAGDWRWSVFRVRFMSYIYYFYYINGCIATSVVETHALSHSSLRSRVWSPILLIFTCLHYFCRFSIRCAELVTSTPTNTWPSVMPCVENAWGSGFNTHPYSFGYFFFQFYVFSLFSSFVPILSQNLFQNLFLTKP